MKFLVVTLAVVLSLLFIIGFGSPSQAEPATALADQAKETVMEVKEPVRSKIAEVRVRLERIRDLKSEVANAQVSDEVLDKVVNEMKTNASFFKEFAENESVFRDSIVDGIENIHNYGEPLEQLAANSLRRANELKQKATQAKLPGERRGFLTAAGMAQRRVELSRTVLEVNSNLGNGLKEVDGLVQNFTRIARANAAVFEESVLTLQFTRDVKKATEILREVDGAELEKLVTEMEQTWRSLDEMVARMTQDAKELAVVSARDQSPASNP